MMSHSKEMELIKDNHRTETGGVNMCKAIQELIAEGESRGTERGIEDGIELTKKVYRLYAQGFSHPQIAKECNITVKRVKYILDDSAA